MNKRISDRQVADGDHHSNLRFISDLGGASDLRSGEDGQRRRFRPMPVPLSSFIGRRSELASLTSLVLEPRNRLITVTGPGGVGKTRLALQVASSVEANFADGVAFADISNVREPKQVPDGLVLALGLRRLDMRSPLSVLVNELRPLEVLLLLDNFEHVVEAARDLAQLLEACPRLTALVTSRSHLNLAGEHIVQVHPLPVVPTGPDGSLGIDAPPGDLESEESDAVRLFVDRCQHVVPTFELTQQNAEDIAKICARLDGLPLAIELAAVRSVLFTPAALLDRLDSRLPLLSGLRGFPERQRTMRDTISWSYDLLDPEEQRVLRSLAIFAGGCTVEAAESVCGGKDDDRDVLLTIESLVRQSLVLVDDFGDYGTTRLKMLDTVREFAIEALAANDEMGTAGERHCRYYLDLARRAESASWGDAVADKHAILDAEIGNLHGALAWASEYQQTDTALRLASAMFDAQWMFDPLWLTSEVARDHGRRIERALAMPGGFNTHRVSALICASYLAASNGDSAHAHSLLNEAVKIASDQSDHLGLATAFFARGRIAFRENRLDAARRYLSVALTGFESVGAKGRAAWALCFLASIKSRQAIDEGGNAADLEQASRLCETALATFLEVDHFPGIVRARHGIAYIAYKQRDLVRALKLTQEVLRLAWSNRRMVDNYLNDIGDIAGRAGLSEIAARLYGAADKERARHGESLPAVYESEEDRDRELASSALGKKAFVDAWKVGHSMPLSQAVEEALSLVLPPSDRSGSPLTRREVDVLSLLAEGKTSRAIGAELFLSHRTVEHHIARLAAKFGVHTRAEILDEARAAGLLEKTND